MKRNARLFVVMLGLGVAGGAWAASPEGAVGPSIQNTVRTQKSVGPLGGIAVKNHKAVGPFRSNAVHMDKAVGQDEKRAGHRPLLDLNAGF
jgi:hypothetical protein